MKEGIQAAADWEQAQEMIRRGALKAPARMVWGRGSLAELGALAAPYAAGAAALVVTGGRSARRSGLAERVRQLLAARGVTPLWATGVSGEPDLAAVEAAVTEARRARPALVVSVGGGSVLDTGKVMAALAVNDGPVRDYLEGVGAGRRLDRTPLPHLAVPTVAGTGAEMTRNAVVTVPDQGCKRSMRDERMIPTVALIDPELTLTVPPEVTAAGGMDALTQLIEPCISVKRNPAVTALAGIGLRLVREALPACHARPRDVAAREAMALASALSGICLANAGLAMAHGIAAALGALHDLPHGLACGLLLPHTLAYNQPACEAEMAGALAAFLHQGAPDSGTLPRGLEAIRGLNDRLGIPPDLKFLRLTEPQLRRIARQSAGSSMAGNPRPMDEEATLSFLRSLA